MRLGAALPIEFDNTPPATTVITDGANDWPIQAMKASGHLTVLVVARWSPTR